MDSLLYQQCSKKKIPKHKNLHMRLFLTINIYDELRTLFQLPNLKQEEDGLMEDGYEYLFYIVSLFERIRGKGYTRTKKCKWTKKTCFSCFIRKKVY